MTDTRLNDCLDRWPGWLPEYIHQRAADTQRISLTYIARHCRLRYQPDAGDHWKTPDETWNDRCGDCEDIAILTGAMVEAVFPGIEMELVLCWEAGARRGHAVLCVHALDGLLYIDNKVRVPYDEAEFRKLYDEHSRLMWPA